MKNNNQVEELNKGGLTGTIVALIFDTVLFLANQYVVGLFAHIAAIISICSVASFNKPQYKNETNRGAKIFSILVLIISILESIFMIGLLLLGLVAVIIAIIFFASSILFPLLKEQSGNWFFN